MSAHAWISPDATASTYVSAAPVGAAGTATGIAIAATANAIDTPRRKSDQRIPKVCPDPQRLARRPASGPEHNETRIGPPAYGVLFPRRRGCADPKRDDTMRRGGELGGVGVGEHAVTSGSSRVRAEIGAERRDGRARRRSCGRSRDGFA